MPVVRANPYSPNIYIHQIMLEDFTTYNAVKLSVRSMLSSEVGVHSSLWKIILTSKWIGNPIPFNNAVVKNIFVHMPMLDKWLEKNVEPRVTPMNCSKFFWFIKLF